MSHRLLLFVGIYTTRLIVNITCMSTCQLSAKLGLAYCKYERAHLCSSSRLPFVGLRPVICHSAVQPATLIMFSLLSVVGLFSALSSSSACLRPLFRQSSHLSWALARLRCNLPVSLSHIYSVITRLSF